MSLASVAAVVWCAQWCFLFSRWRTPGGYNRKVFTRFLFTGVRVRFSPYYSLPSRCETDGIVVVFVDKNEKFVIMRHILGVKWRMYPWLLLFDGVSRSIPRRRNPYVILLSRQIVRPGTHAGNHTSRITSTHCSKIHFLWGSNLSLGNQLSLKVSYGRPHLPVWTGSWPKGSYWVWPNLSLALLYSYSTLTTWPPCWPSVDFDGGE